MKGRVIKISTEKKGNYLITIESTEFPKNLMGEKVEITKEEAEEAF